RCCYWKQWKTHSNRVRQLVSLGVDLRTAVKTAVTRLGHWKMSKTPGVSQALSKGYLKGKGVPSLVELWTRVHYPDTSR
ncbi:hypothetical protein QEH56_24620, partial [Pelagicoccus enzymogenes]